MPIEVLKDAAVFINAVDLSNHVESVTLSYSNDVQEATVMGDAGKRRIPGLKDWSAEISFRQDFDAASVEATIWPLLGVQTAIRIRKSKTDAISATNPEYQGNGIIGELPLVSGSVGEVHNTSVTVSGSDGVGLIRDITP
jgi:hypothetical protein